MNAANSLHVLGYYNELFSLSNLKFAFLCNSDPVLWLKICNKKDAVSLDWSNKATEETDREESTAGALSQALLWGHVLYPRGTQDHWWCCQVSNPSCCSTHTVLYLLMIKY